MGTLSGQGSLFKLTCQTTGKCWLNIMHIHGTAIYIAFELRVRKVEHNQEDDLIKRWSLHLQNVLC